MVTSGAELVAVKQPRGQQTVALLLHSRKSHFRSSVLSVKHQPWLVSTATLPCHPVAEIQLYMTKPYRVISHVQKGETFLEASLSPSSLSPSNRQTLIAETCHCSRKMILGVWGGES